MNGAYHYEKEPKALGEEYKFMPVKNFASHIADSLQMLCMYVAEQEDNDVKRKQLLDQIGRNMYSGPSSSIAGY